MRDGFGHQALLDVRVTRVADKEIRTEKRIYRRLGRIVLQPGVANFGASFSTLGSRTTKDANEDARMVWHGRKIIAHLVADVRDASMPR